MKKNKFFILCFDESRQIISMSPALNSKTYFPMIFLKTKKL